MDKLRSFLLPVLALAVLSVSFWYSRSWLQLCAGLALFLFGMQCLEKGLKNLAGGRLEQLLERSTATPFKGFAVGVGHHDTAVDHPDVVADHCFYQHRSDSVGWWYLNFAGH